MNNIHESNRLSLSVVVPLFNEEEVVVELYNRLKNVLENLNRSYEIVFVEDGSKDNTLNKLLTLKRNDSTVRIIKLRGNFGQTSALSAGFDHAEGDVIIAMDGDLQHMPEEIPKFIEKMDEGYDIVSGWREDRKDAFLTRRLPSKIANWLMAQISGIDLHDFGTTFKAYKKEIIKELTLYGQFHRFIPVLASWMKVETAEIPIENIRPQHRKSHYNITRTYTVFFDLIRLNFLNKFLTKPLQLFGTLGLTLDFIGFCIASYLIYLKYAYGLGLLQYRAPLFLLSILLILIGVLFLILGLLGEMIVKLSYESSRRKSYSIDRVYHAQEERD
jgi:glycosyltransferase involved in cell wall biosynthesis